MLNFKKKDPNRLKEKERVREDSQKAVDMAMGEAQNCLNHEFFRKYREAYEGLERKLIRELMFIDETEFDPVRYGFAVKDVVGKLRHVGILMQGVSKDAGK